MQRQRSSEMAVLRASAVIVRMVIVSSVQYFGPKAGAFTFCDSSGSTSAGSLPAGPIAQDAAWPCALPNRRSI